MKEGLGIAVYSRRGGCELLLGHERGDQSVGMAVAQLMLGLEVANKFHVLERGCVAKDLHPVGDKLPYFASIKGK